MTPAPVDTTDLEAYLDECRQLVEQELRRLVPSSERYGAALYDRMLDYPLREAKGLRPALCMATCRALGGGLQNVLPTAAVLELYHNAFLIHDDVEDGSARRRGEPTLHRMYGIPVAINVGDAMLALALQPLLDNMRTIGMGPALRALQEVADMARVSTEGQAIELEWIRCGRWDLGDDDYIEMVSKKTARYTFVTPMRLGAMIARNPRVDFEVLGRFANALGVAFQIQDDILNVTGDEQHYGKEIGGDLWEGKHTLVLLHALRCATKTERARALEILAKPRHVVAPAPSEDGLDELLGELRDRGEVTAAAISAISEFRASRAGDAAAKTTEEVAFLHELLTRTGGAEYARKVALAHAEQAAEALEQLSEWLQPSVHAEVLEDLVQYVVDRAR